MLDEEMLQSQLESDVSETDSVKCFVSATSKSMDFLPLTFVSPRLAGVKLGAGNPTE